MNNNLPPSPFGVGTVYTGKTEHVVSPEQHDAFRRREVGGEALRSAAVLPPPRIWRPQEHFSPEVERRQYLEKILRFPRPEDYDQDYEEGYDVRTQVTEKSAAHAAEVYQWASQDIKDIIDKYNEVDSGQDAAALLRANDQLRIELGLHILQKFEHTKGLPERVENNFANVLKSPNHTKGYNGERFESRDYATLLALAMLDGTFRAPRWSNNDAAQHRIGAELVLGIYQKHLYANDRDVSV